MLSSGLHAEACAACRSQLIMLRLSAHQEVKLHPGDNLSFGSEVPECTFQVKLAHHSVEEQLKSYLQKIERVQEQLGESTEVTHKDLAAMN